MTGSFYSVSTLLNQMIMACYQVRTQLKKLLGVLEGHGINNCHLLWSCDHSRLLETCSLLVNLSKVRLTEAAHLPRTRS